MFASRVGTNPKCVAHLPSLLEVVLAGKNTVNNPFLGLGHTVGVSLRGWIFFLFFVLCKLEDISFPSLP